MGGQGEGRSEPRRLLPGAVADRIERRLARAPRRPPGQLIATAFLTLIGIGTLLLLLPISKAGPGSTDVLTALFTATSAACIVGLTVVDTGTAWTGFGQVVILVLMQIGGLGIMAGASLIGITVSRRLGLRTRVMAAAETRTVDLADVRRVVVGVATLSLTIEAFIAVALTLRFALAYDYGWGTSLWYGLFHAVSSFNNAGFALFSDSLVGFVGDPFICVPLCVGVILGGLGFPVLFEVFRDRRRRGLHRLTPNTWLTLTATGALVLIGTVTFLAIEWSNPGTLGPLSPGTKLVASFTQGVMPRTAGFNSLDYTAMDAATIAITLGLMYVGGGASSTAGGIKVGTAAVAAGSVWAQLRGDDDTVLARRTVPPGIVSQAYALIVLFTAALAIGVFAMLWVSDLDLENATFQATSALTTTGLATVDVGALPSPAQVVLIVLMFVGRLGPVSLGAALALRERHRRFRYPEGRPYVG